ncbi:hypothetical protein [Lysinibacillus sp. G4S2]|uniref:hypothetical protein n=1 Tax=Lysinibacillus sp. G4S2 TaxID=3055859 RepID=UPI0025A18BF5|nr:hypothetical protein [Lysinibacillus sp. G4S2]MDM5250979.1 hypothetical protein [Lysinibacillus sp. G4S2]
MKHLFFHRAIQESPSRNGDQPLILPKSHTLFTSFSKTGSSSFTFKEELLGLL